MNALIFFFILIHLRTIYLRKMGHLKIIRIQQIGAVALAILSMGKWLLPMGKQLFVSFVCDRFPQGKLAWRKFSWIRQKNKQTNTNIIENT